MNLSSLGGFGGFAPKKLKYDARKIDTPYLESLSVPYRGIRETPLVAAGFGIGPKMPDPRGEGGETYQMPGAKEKLVMARPSGMGFGACYFVRSNEYAEH